MQISAQVANNSVGYNVNYTIYTGEYVTLQYAITSGGSAMNLTGYSAKMQINFPTPLLLQTPSSGLAIPTPTNGIVNATLTNAQTEVVAGTYTWDFWLIISGQPVPYLSGAIAVQQGVTPVP